jgi:heme/copper-type cytochrome/quinol oxidase subunit 3
MAPLFFRSIGIALPIVNTLYFSVQELHYCRSFALLRGKKQLAMNLWLLLNFCFHIHCIQAYEYVMLLFYIWWSLWLCFFLLTGFHGIHVIMVLFLFYSIYSFNKDHLSEETIWVLRHHLVLALCRFRLASLVYYVYAYGSNIL